MAYREYTHLDYEFPEPGILRIMFNNPKSLNSVSVEQHTELARVWADIDRDPDVLVVIVTGAGDAFSSGGDFGLIEQMAEDFEGRIHTMREARDICYGVVNCSKPIVSAMTGPAYFDHEIPHGSTNFNFFTEGALGATVLLQDNLHLFGGVSLIHVSNAGLIGNDNEGSTALGGFLGLLWTF